MRLYAQLLKGSRESGGRTGKSFKRDGAWYCCLEIDASPSSDKLEDAIKMEMAPYHSTGKVN